MKRVICLLAIVVCLNASGARGNTNGTTDPPEFSSNFQAELVGAVAEIVIERMEQELVRYGAGKVQNELCKADTNRKDGKYIYLENFCTILSIQVEENIIQMGRLLREALVQDMVQFPLVISKNIDSSTDEQDQEALLRGIVLAAVKGADYFTKNATVSEFTTDLKSFLENEKISGETSGVLIKALEGKVNGNHSLPNLTEGGAVQLSFDFMEAIDADTRFNKATTKSEKLFEEKNAKKSRVQTIEDMLSKLKEFAKTKKLNSSQIKIVNAALDSVLSIYQGIIEKRFELIVLNAFKLADALKVPVNSNIRAVFATAVDLASATTKDEMKSILEASIAPLGSYMTKRSGGSSLTITALPGLIGGVDYVSNREVESRYITSGRLFLPLGFDYNLGSSDNGWTLGLFVPLVDFGTLLNIRNDIDLEAKDGDSNNSGNETLIEVQTPEDAEFKNFFSPGLYVRFGIFETPLVIGFGASLLPDALVMELPEPVGSQATNVIRYGAFLSVDVTLFPLW